MFGLNKWLVGGAVALVLVLGVALWWQNNKIETLQENNVKLEQAVEQQKKVVEQKERDIEDYREAVGRLTREKNRLREEYEDLNQRFNKVKPDGTQRDLGKIGISKPKLLERVVNKATDEANRCLELAMGAERTEEEKNASKKSQINSECPSLANPNYSPSE